jgi:hypothetical protein
MPALAESGRAAHERPAPSAHPQAPPPTGRHQRRRPTGAPEETSHLDDLFTRDPQQPGGPSERPRWLVPAMLAVLALALIIAAYAVGRAFSTSVSADKSGPSKLVIPSGGSGTGGPSGGEPTANQKPGAPYTGPTDLADIAGATASCQAGDAFDAGGNKVSYQPGNVFDQDMSTAWRCGGDGHGEKLTLTLAKAMPIGEVGMVPGYAKTDPYDGTDRYAQNDRITKVRWTFDDGRSFVQHLDGSAHNRRMQTMRVPVTTTRTITMTILDSTRGPLNTVAVSEVRIGRVAG